MTGPLTDVHAHLWPEDYLALLKEHHRPVSGARAMNATDRPSHRPDRRVEHGRHRPPTRQRRRTDA